MKPFDQKLEAWLRGDLRGRELEEFESSLPAVTEAELVQQEQQGFTTLLKQHLGPHTMANEDFFSHQLRQEIERETPKAPANAPAHSSERVSWWSIGRLAWAGAAALAIFAASALFLTRDQNVGGTSTYLTQIINARVDPVVSPNATISVFETKQDKVTVIWVDGLQSLPSEYAAK